MDADRADGGERDGAVRGHPHFFDQSTRAVAAVYGVQHVLKSNVDLQGRDGDLRLADVRVLERLLQLLAQLREGDTVVVWQLDRLARSTRDLLELVERIHTAGARFQSLTEPWADTTSHVGKFILTVFAGLAEFERDLIRERAFPVHRRNFVR